MRRAARLDEATAITLRDKFIEIVSRLPPDKLAIAIDKMEALAREEKDGKQ